MAPVAQAIRNNEIPKTEYSEKAAIDALYNELSKGIDSMKKGDVYTIDEAWDPDYTKLTLAEKNELEEADVEIRNGETVSHEEINWD